MKYSRLLIFFFLLSFFSLDAQQLITSYSVDQGLPQSTVTALYRDNEGYLWCGTGAGVGLYDGFRFNAVKASVEKENPSLNAIVRGIIASADQKTMWIGTESTMNQVDRKTYRLMRSFDVDKNPGIGEVPIYANDTAVWAIVWTQGLYRIRIADGKATRLTNNGFRNHGAVTSDGQSIVFLDTTNQMCVYNIISNTKNIVPTPSLFAHIEVTCFKSLPGKPQSVLVSTTSGLWLLDIEASLLTRYMLGNPLYTDSTMNFRGMDFDPDGNLWIGALGYGVLRYDLSQRTLRPCIWQQDGTNAIKLLSNITFICCDAYGVVWCGTDGDGVVKLLHNRVTFRERFTQNLVTDTCSWFCRAFFELSPNRFLVGTYRGGLQRVDYVSNTISTVTSGPLWEGTTPLFITGLDDGRLLIGTDRNLLVFDTTTFTTIQVDENVNESSNRKYVGAVKQKSGDILVYGNNSLQKLILSPVPSLSEVIGLPWNATSAIQLADGRIVVAHYYRGLAIFNSDLSLADTIPYTEMGLKETTSVRRMLESKTGELMFATESGLYFLDKDFKVRNRVEVANGLSDNNIYDMIGIGGDEILLATGHGVTIFNLQNKNCSRYLGGDGLPSEECNSGALLFAPSGMVYIGTTAGFVRWDPRERNTCYRQSLILASFGGSEDGPSGIISESIVRDYGSGTIDILVWITDFAFPERTEYSHMLEGAETEFALQTGIRNITYAALGSGFYSLLVSAALPGCESTGTTKLLTVKIVPPFWMSGWFIGISIMGVVLVITLILFVMMRMNYQRKLRKLRMQQELDKVRARISRDIHDDIGAGLTRIALSGELMSVKAAGDSQQQEKLKWIAGTARELSQNMKEVVWSVNPHYDSLDHMAAYFRSYVAGVAENAELRFRYVADENLPAEEVNPETRRNLLLILKESISNAVKYSGCTQLTLEIHWRNNLFTMKISDNGGGFDTEADDKVNSNGLRNIRQRAEASRCQVAISSSPSDGTSITVTGPIGD